MYLAEDFLGRKGSPYKVVIPNSVLINCLNIMDNSKINYNNYLVLDKYAKVVSTNLSAGDTSPKVNYVVAMRNVYKNQVAIHRDGKFYMLLESDTWIDKAPFDDYSVIGAKRCCHRSFGAYPAKYTSEVVYPSLNLRVEGAIYLNEQFYVFTQVIFSDEVSPEPNHWKLKNISKVVPKTELENKLLECLTIVKKEG